MWHHGGFLILFVAAFVGLCLWAVIAGGDPRRRQSDWRSTEEEREAMRRIARDEMKRSQGGA